MARQPVQLPSRGGANASGVGNRAQYLRPAKDTQNSRALSNAFSQMNRAFSRIAANEDRLENQRLADEFREAQEAQKLLEERAKFAGQMSVLTGEDQAALYANNPAAQQSYYEGSIQSEVSQGLVGIANDFREQPFYGDPTKQAEARQWLQNSYAEAFGDVDPLILGGMLSQINTQSASLLKENDNEVFAVAQAETVTQMTNSLHSAIVNLDSGMFLAEVETMKENAYFDMGGPTGNQITVKSLEAAIRQAANGTQEEFIRANENFADLLANPDFMNSLNTEQREKLQTSLSSARNRFDANLKTLELRRQQAQEVEAASLDQQLAFAYLRRDQKQMNELINLYAKIDYKTDKWVNRAQTIIDNLDVTKTSFLIGSDVDSKRNLALAKHYLDVNNIDQSNIAFVEYVISQQSNLTEKDFDALMSYSPNLNVEAFKHPAYLSATKHMGALGDLVNSLLADGSDELARILPEFEVTGFDGTSIFKRKMLATMSEYLTENQANYPAGYEAQKSVINDAVAFALNDFLDETEENGVNLIDRMRGPDGLLPQALVNDPVFKSYFTNSGYEQQAQQARAIIREAEDRAIDMLPSSVEIDPALDQQQPFTFEAPSQIQTLEVPTSEEPANPMTNRAGSRQRSASSVTPTTEIEVVNSSPETVDVIPAEMPQIAREANAADPEGVASAKTASEFAKAYLGQTETDNHKVLTDFIKEAVPSFNDVRKTAWCAGFVNAVLNQTGDEGTSKTDGALSARSFLNWGKSVSEPQEGDVVVLWRESKSSWKGHVGFFAGFDDNGDILVLGGNQNNSVSIKSYDKDRLLGYRRSE